MFMRLRPPAVLSPADRPDVLIGYRVSAARHRHRAAGCSRAGRGQPDLRATASSSARRLIGQTFWIRSISGAGPRPPRRSPTTDSASGGSNLGPTNPALLDAVKANVKALHEADPGNRQPIPVDLVTASGSGLDPEISLAGRSLPGRRVARARSLAVERVEALINAHQAGRLFGFIGERARQCAGAESGARSHELAELSG